MFETDILSVFVFFGFLGFASLVAVIYRSAGEFFRDLLGIDDESNIS